MTLRRLKPAFFLLLALTGCSLKPAPSFRRFACYYGHGRLEELSRYDLVILEPSAYNPSDIKELRSKGSTVLAYISLGEDAVLHRGDGLGPGGQAAWYLDQFTGPGLRTPGPDGKPDQNSQWESYYVDPSHPAWRKFIKNDVKRLKAMGFNGLFIDTVLIPRNAYTINFEKRHLEEGMRTLVASLRRWWPSGYLLANNAWENLESWNRKIDGVMLENFPLDRSGEFEKIGREIKRLNRLGGFSLEYIPARQKSAEDALCRRAEGYGFLGAVYLSDGENPALDRLPVRTCP